jgi:tetratricopeptide (TPR) repeat protein
LTADVQSPRVLDPRIPVDLETICLKALEKNVSHRYSSAGEMRDDLRRFLEGRRIRARRAGTLTRAKRFVLRHGVAVMAVLAGAIAVSLGTAVYQQSRTHKETSEINDATAQEQAAKIAEVEQRNEELKALIEAITPVGWSMIQDSVSAGEGDEQEALQALANRFGASYMSDYLENERQRLQFENPSVAVGSFLEYYLSALSALASGNIPAARAVLDLSLNVAPNEPSALRLRALVHCRRGDWQSMMKDTEALLAAHPDDPSGHFLCGAAYLFDDQPRAAIREFEQASANGADGPWLHTLTGSAYLRLNQHVPARESFDRALTQSPGLASALLGRARCSYASRAYVQAIADATAVIEADADFGDAYVLRGDASTKLERYDEALSDYARAYQFKKGSTTLAGKIWLAQANKQEHEHAESMGEEMPMPDSPALDEQDDFFYRFLQEQLQSNALCPYGPPGEDPGGFRLG